MLSTLHGYLGKGSEVT